MQAAEYPDKKCREGLYNDHGMGYTCELPLMHPGPCASFSIPSLGEHRDRWEANNPEWRKDIGKLEDEV